MRKVENGTFVNCDEEHIHALMFLGLNITQVNIKSFSRNKPYNGEPGVLTVELDTLADKRMVLRNKLITRSTHEYQKVFIDNLKYAVIVNKNNASQKVDCVAKL